jgi:HD-GYP domain-containing protein (c-di-GMP phosphodiesterase class II)
MNLEEKLEKTAKKLLISEKDRNLIKKYADLIKEFDIPTDEHCSRVALKCIEISEAMEMGINISRALYYGARLHDLGKIGIPKKILNKKVIGVEDMDTIKSHTRVGAVMTADSLRHTSYICEYHHFYQNKGYPKKMEITGLKAETLSKLDKEIRIISLVDYYDAITHRDNNRFGSNLSKSEIMQKMHDNYRDVTMSKMINLFYMIKVFKS